MKSEFEVENINWFAVVLVSAMMFIAGFTFFNEIIGAIFAAISILGTSYVTGRSKGKVSKIIDMATKEVTVEEKKE